MSRVDAAISRAENRLFAHYGDEAVLRYDAAHPIVVVISDNVAITGENGLVSHLVTTATFRRADNPRIGDPLSVKGKAWMLDALLRGDGNTVEFVLRDA